MKKIHYTLLLFVCVILFAACKNAPAIPESVTLNVTQSEVYGDNSELLSVVQGAYKLKCSDRVRLKVRLKLNEKVDREISEVYSPDLRLKDEDGISVLEGSIQMVLAQGEKEKLLSFLKSEPGTEQDFVFINDFSYDYAREVMEKAHGFSIENIRITFKDDVASDGLDELEEGLNTLGKTIEMMDGVLENSGAMLETSKQAMDMLEQLGK